MLCCVMCDDVCFCVAVVFKLLLYVCVVVCVVCVGCVLFVCALLCGVEVGFVVIIYVVVCCCFVWVMFDVCLLLLY